MVAEEGAEGEEVAADGALDAGRLRVDEEVVQVVAEYRRLAGPGTAHGHLNSHCRA